MQDRTVPLSTLIVDDEQLARDELAYLLKNIGDVEIVSTTPIWSSSMCRCRVLTASA
jgi:DNA-binding NarL/FixJ family response regulator